VRRQHAEQQLPRLGRIRGGRCRTGHQVVQLTEAPLDLDNPRHLNALKRAYERFPELGGRAAP
jgi:hypothetical protein